MKHLLLLLCVFNVNLLKAQSFIDFLFKSKDVNGSICIYNEKENQWIFNNETDVKTPHPPGALFHLYHALIGLQTGKISTASDEIEPWDGIPNQYFNYPMPKWDCNTNLEEALQNSNDWYFDRISEHITTQEYNNFLNNYSTKILHRDFPYFWNFGGILTTSEQQILFLKHLNTRELPFDATYQHFVMDKMLIDINDKYTLYGYSSFTVYKGKRIDWWIGILKTKNNTIYFSTKVFEDVEKDIQKKTNTFKYTITFETFKELGYL